MEYSIALFFNKLVSYTFLFWLPLYIKNTRMSIIEHCVVYFIYRVHFDLSDSDLSGKESDWLSTAFDVGGILGE